MEKTVHKVMRTAIFKNEVTNARRGFGGTVGCKKFR